MSLQLLLLLTILHKFEVRASCSFSIEAVTQTPKRYATLDSKSPDCDDTAIIINEVNTSDSRIVGTLKQGGLELYTLHGKLLQHINAPDPPQNNATNMPGRFNNVAALKSLKDPDKTVVIVTDRGLDQLRFYALNATTALLEDITNATIPWVFSTSQEMVNKQETAYGVTATNYGNTMTVFVTKRHQNIIAKINLIETGPFISYEVIDTLTLPLILEHGWTACPDTDGETPQIEGMVVDPRDGTLLIAQETVGLFKTTVKGGNYTLIDAVYEYGVMYARVWDSAEEEYKCIYNGTDYGLRGNIVADAEGISLYVDDDDTMNGGFYVLSTQGANRFNIYSRNTFHFIGNFSVYLGDDMVQNTDGVEIKNRNFGTDYAEGIIIVQDEGDADDTNFKFASFADILDAIGECENIYSSTMYYVSTTNMIETTNGGSDSGSKIDESAEELAILVLAIIFGVLFVLAIAIYVYFKCTEKRGSKGRPPQNYVELGGK